MPTLEELAREKIGKRDGYEFRAVAQASSLRGQRGVPSVVCHIPAIPTETFDFIITAERHRFIHDLPLAA